MHRPWLALIESNTTGTGRLFVQAARDLGLRPVLLTADDSRYDYLDAVELEMERADTSNEEALIEVCKRLRDSGSLAGVTSSSEYFVATAAAVAERLGLRGPDPRAVRDCRDKGTQRERLRAARVGAPLFITADSAPEAVHAAQTIGLPVVVKPVSGTGSSGVRLCHNFCEVEEHARQLLGRVENERGIRVPRRVLVEQFVSGPEFSVETFGTEVIGITGKHVGEPPHFVETGHDFPRPLPEAEAESLRRATTEALSALGLGWGPAHTELRLTDEGPKIIEVNPRLAGGMIPELVRLAAGVDMVSETLRAVAGMPRVPRAREGRFASLRFVIPERRGRLVSVEGLEDAARVPGVVSVRMYVRPGDSVGRRGDFRDRVGHVIALGDDFEKAKAAAERALGLIRSVVDESSEGGRD